MLRPSSIRLYERTLRLKAESRSHATEERMRKEQLKETRNREFATLIGSHLSGLEFESAFVYDLFLIRSYWTNFYCKNKGRKRSFRSVFLACCNTW
jgi:hypothetical protein